MLGPDEGARAVSPYSGRRCGLRLGRISVPGRPGREGGLSGRPYPRQLECWGVDSAVSLMLVGSYNWAEAGWSTSPDIRTQLCVRGPWMVGHTTMKPAKQPAGSPSLSKTEDGTRTPEFHQTRETPARRPRDPDSRPRPNRETARFPIRIPANLQSKIGKPLQKNGEAGDPIPDARLAGNRDPEMGNFPIRFP
jgi:hypothetical protein